MKVLSVELDGYNRFGVNGATKFKLTASALLQIIIGTNGSGKSSLLEAISPFPQPKSDFFKGGSRILNIEHNNSHYRLVSNYSGGGKHRFEKDGEENNLNPGGTATVQKELVESELGISSQLHDLFTGSIKFTTMSATQRRDWITRLSGLDVRFIAGLYDSIRVEARDLKGAIRHNETRLGRESEKLLDEDETRDLQSINGHVQDRLAFLLENRNTSTAPYDDSVRVYKELSAKLHDLSKKVVTMNLSHPDMANLQTFESIVDRENTLRNNMGVSKALLTETAQGLDDIRTTLRKFRDEEAIDVVGLENKLGTLQEVLGKMSNFHSNFTIEGDLEQVLGDTKSLRMPIHDFIGTLTGERLGVPPRRDWEAIRTTHEEKSSEKAAVDHTIKVLSNKVKTIENSVENKCPKCSYVWKPGVSERELEIVTEKLEREIARGEKLAMEIIHGDERLGRINKRREEVESFRYLVRSYPRLRPLWVYISDEKMIDGAPHNIIGAYEDWFRAVSNAYGMHNLTNEIDEVESTIKRVRAIDGKVDIDFFAKKEKELDDKVNTLQQAVVRIREELLEIRKYKITFQEIQNALTSIVTTTEAVKKQQQLVMEAKLQQYLGEQIKEDQITLANGTRRLTEINTLTGIVEDLKTNLEDLRADYEANQLLEKALSPVDGVQADAVGGFINVFIGQLNDIVGKIWEYDMRIIPCGKDTGSLDYRFPLSVLSTDTVAPDISKASDGQKEVIDYAFTLAVMAYLDLKDYPLFLDELGATFDEAHRKKLVHFNKGLIEGNQCSQIWMISHFITEHGGMTDSETCVLDATNVAVPEVYNKHVEMS